MKKIAALVLFFMILNILNALGTLHVKSVKELPATHTNLKVYDADGKYAPVLIIKTELKGLGIQNVGRPTKHAPEYMAGDHQYKFYMNDSQRVVKITHADYEPLEVRLLADFGIEVKAQRVYEMLLDNTPEKEFINVVIISDPVDATKIIDGKDMGTGQSFELFIGKHILKLQKNGFKSLTKNIEVSRSKTLFNNLELQEVEPVMITIKSEPDEADIYINNVNEGKTNKQLFKFPGNYNLRLVKDKYDTTEQNITVTESGTNTFDYTLQKNTSLLTINTTPSNCEIYVNNEKISGNSKEVSAGMYRVEVKKTGYYEQSRTVNVEKGRNKTESFILEQKTGKLQFVVEPMEAKITLKQGNSAVQSWNGSKYLSSLAIGNYTITASLSGYTSQTKQVKINLDETTKVNMSLQKGYEPPQSPFSGGSREGMVFVKGGTFQMGSNEQNDEKPIHSVTVSDFYIGKYEVTQKEWKAVMGSNPSNWKGDNLPVEKVSWYDAVEFCNKKSEKEGLQKCYNGSGANITCDFSKNGYRLPTEAEWEYAARGGNKSRNYKYSGSNKIDDVAWYTSNSGSKTHNVGTKQANELGIHDMSGNVWEWCNDWYDKNYYSSSPKNNPKGAYSGSYRILGGGSWRYDGSGAFCCRVAGRGSLNPDGGCYDYGFRFLRTP